MYLLFAKLPESQPIGVRSGRFVLGASSKVVKLNMYCYWYCQLFELLMIGERVLDVDANSHHRQVNQMIPHARNPSAEKGAAALFYKTFLMPNMIWTHLRSQIALHRIAKTHVILVRNAHSAK